MRLLAYWHTLHGDHSRRTAMSHPATYQDLLSALLVSKGRDPSNPGSPPASARSGGPKVLVHDGGRTRPATPSEAALVSGMTGNAARRKMSEAGFTDDELAFWLDE